MRAAAVRLRRCAIIAVSVALPGLVAGCAASPQAVSPAPPIHVQLLALNDFHGHLEPPATPTRLPPLQPGGQERLLPTGGVAWLSGVVADLRRESQHSVVVAAGDLFGGTPLTSALLRHEPTIDALGALPLEFSAVGNHEFDRGVEELQRLAGRARFQYLAANVRVRSTGATLFPAWARKRFELGGGRHLDIAFVGVVLRNTPALVNEDIGATVEFGDEADAINQSIAEIRAAGIETIVALVHEGGFTNASRFDDPGCPEFRGPILGIVDRLDPAVDIVVSGHTHRTYVCERNGRLVTSAGNEGRFVTDIDLTIDPVSRDLLHAEARQRPVINDTLANPLAAQFPIAKQDGRLGKRLAAWQASVATQATRVVGHLAGGLTRRRTAAGETSLGDVVADAQLAATASAGTGGAQIAFVNNGGLRADLAPPGGHATYADVFAVHPFGNFLVTLTLTGAEIDTLLETQWRGAGSLLQVSGGFSFSWRADAVPGERIRPEDILLNGRPLDPEAAYRVTVSDFLAGGGDGYTVLQQGRDRIPGVADVAALERYLEVHSPVSVPTGGRILLQP